MIRAVKCAWLSLPAVALQPLRAGPGSSGAFPPGWYRNILQQRLCSNELFSEAILLLFFTKAPLLCQDN